MVYYYIHVNKCEIPSNIVNFRIVYFHLYCLLASYIWRRC